MLRCALAALLVGSAGLHAQPAPPVPFRGSPPALLQTGIGRFEIITSDPLAGRVLVRLADAMWRSQERVLGLPAGGFGSAVVVRVVAADQWTEPGPFRSFVEQGGRVTVNLRWEPELPAAFALRALAQGLILRQAVAWHGVSERVTAPLWLELAVAETTLAGLDPAWEDELRRVSADLAAPPLTALLAWERGAAEPEAWTRNTVWLLRWLADDGASDATWGRFLRAILGGDPGVAALTRLYRSRFDNAVERELWWRVGQTHLRRGRTALQWTPAETREWLTTHTRVIVRIGDRETVLEPEGQWEARAAEAVRTTVALRLEVLGPQLPALHPYYVNAGVALGRLWEALLAGDATRFAAARIDLAEDWAEAVGLEIAGRTLLDLASAAAR